MDKKQVLMWYVFVGSVTAFLIYKLGRKSAFGQPATSYDTFKRGKVLITKPNNDAKTYNVIYVFGGMAYADKEWMKEQMSKSYFLNNIVVLSNYTDSFSNAKSELNDFMSQNDITADKVSLIGFSAGGLNVLANYSKYYKFVGLIDPSNKPEHLNINFGKNAYMVYNQSNWGSYPNIQANLPKLAKKVAAADGYANETSMSHKSIPKYFFENFADIHRIKN